MGVKSPPWVGNPFPTLLATLNITYGREILLTVFLHYPQTWWERDFQPEIRVKKGGEGIPHPILRISCPWGGQEGWERDFALMGSCQEGWGRDSPPTGGFPALMGCVKKGGKGISHPRGILRISCPRQEGLLEDDHLAGGGVIACGEVVEIYTACDLLAELVSAVPVDCFCSALVDCGELVSNVDVADDAPAAVIDG